MSKYGKSDLGADLHPCEKCGVIGVLMFSLCHKCRPEGLLIGRPIPKPESEEGLEKEIRELDIELTKAHCKIAQLTLWRKNKQRMLDELKYKK